MNNKLLTILGSLLLLTLLSACAGSGKYAFIASPTEPHATIVSSIDRQGQFIYPVRIDKVNGQMIARKENAIWLKPGEHTLDAVDISTVDRGYTPGLRGDRSLPSNQQLTANFEAGKVYYVGRKAEGRDRSEWQLVIWKVEDKNS